MSLYEAIIEVMKEVGYVQKEGKVSFGKTNYKYAGEADLISALRPAMVKHGVMMFCSGVDEIKVVDSRVLARYRFTFQKGEESFNVYALGEGADSGDKASYKAATGALKYALRQTFIIETGDDPDKTSSEELNSIFKPGAAPQPSPGYAERKAQKESLTVSYDDGVYTWASSVETLLNNCESLPELKQVFSANQKMFEQAKADAPETVDALRTVYANKAQALM